MSEQNRIPLTILDWKPFTKGALLGFVAIRMGALEIYDVTVLSANGKKWCGLPGKPQFGADGTAKRSSDGKLVYVKVLAWTTKDAHERFSISVIEAMEAAHPGSTG